MDGEAQRRTTDILSTTGIMKHILYFKLFLILIASCEGSPLQNAIKIRLQLQDALGDKLVVVNERNDGKVNIKINEVLYLNLKEGSYRKDVYQSKIPLTEISLKYLESQKILWTETLDSRGYFKSTLAKDVEEQRFTTTDYELFFSNVRLDIKKSYLLTGADAAIKNDENDQNKHLEFNGSIIGIGLLLEYGADKKTVVVKQILKGSVASEFGFQKNDIIKSAWSDNVAASLKNVTSYRFDDKCSSINFDVERSGKAINIKILMPSLMEAGLYSIFDLPDK
jgi:hypothetical protein